MNRKSGARHARHLAKLIKEKEKTVRREEQPETHAVRSEYAKDAPKAVRAGANPGSIFHMAMRWTVESADKDGTWSWGVARDWGEAVWEDELHPKLLEFERLTWAEIAAQTYGNDGKRHRMHHSMHKEEICGEAQQRLTDLEEDAESLFRFRLGNLPRLWGVRIVERFHVLWYDPTHQIYPVD